MVCKYSVCCEDTSESGCDSTECLLQWHITHESKDTQRPYNSRTSTENLCVCVCVCVVCVCVCVCVQKKKLG